MLVYRDLDFHSNEPCVLALGCFDGVHLGHRAVIGEAVRKASETGACPAVFTFSLPPKSVFTGGVSLISHTSDKLSLIESLGVELCACPDPTVEILSMDAEDFIHKIIIEGFSAVHVVCGYNYTFGKGAQGNAELLRKVCNERGIGVTVIPERRHGDTPISSSLIREHIVNGRMESAAELLCRPFSVSASVIDGQHLARRLGFPTLNVIPDSKLVLPMHGVYAVRVLVDGKSHFGIANVGMRPTVDVGIRCVEAHIFDFDGDLYGKQVTVEFLHFIRAERKFDSVELLRNQVMEDIKVARLYFLSL